MPSCPTVSLSPTVNELVNESAGRIRSKTRLEQFLSDPQPLERIIHTDKPVGDFPAQRNIAAADRRQAPLRFRCARCAWPLGH